MRHLHDKGVKVMCKIEQLERQAKFCRTGIEQQNYDAAAEDFVKYLRLKFVITSPRCNCFNSTHCTVKYNMDGV